MSNKVKYTTPKPGGKPGLTPKLRFPEFRDAAGWSIRTLGEFLNERNEYPSEPVPLFSLTIEDGVTPKTERYERAFLVNDEKDAYKLTLPDDFAFNPMNLRFGAIGRHSGSGAVAVSKYYNIFFCDRTADARFCEFYFRSDKMIAFYDRMAIGSLIEKRRVHFNDFLKFEIGFPTLREQQKIAECLSSVDELIATQARKQDALKTHKKGLMHQLFPREGETQPRLRFPEFQASEEWEPRTLGSVCRSFSGGTPSTSQPEYYGGDIPFIRSGEIGRDRTELFLTQAGLSNSAAKIVAKGDVLVALYGANSGDVALAKIDGAINQAILCLKSKESNGFIYQFLSFKKDWVVATYLQGGQGNLSGEIVKSISVCFPAPEEQQRIADCLTSLDDLIAAQTQKLEALKNHKKGLMQQLFPPPEEVEA
jgi:type I restriction enzyme S subunit